VFCGVSCAVLWWSAVRPAVVCGAVCGGLRFSDLPAFLCVVCRLVRMLFGFVVLGLLSSVGYYAKRLGRKSEERLKNYPFYDYWDVKP